jgi:lipopolysaccharide/colanic/teichoic acid biosynthesis glycosyltransferase
MNEKLLRWTVLADLLWIPFALLLSYFSRYGEFHRSAVWQFIQVYLPVLLIVLLLWAVLSAKKELHGFRGGWSFPTILSQVTVGLSLLMIVLLSLAFLTRQYYSRLVLGYFTLYLFLGFVGNRCLARLLVRSRSRNGGKRRVVILGNGPIAKEIAAKVLRHPEMMWEVTGFLYPSCLEFSKTDSVPETPALPTIAALDLLKHNRVQELIVTVSPVASEIRKLLAECRKVGMRVTLVPQFYELYISRARLVEIDGLPLLSLEESLPGSYALLLKRLMDLLFATPLLLLSLPLLLSAGAALYIQKGKAFCKEWRGGRNCLPFWMYRLNIDRYASNSRGYERLLARLSLTELPQLWNVIRGDMALVGPRPESMERVRLYSDWQQQRLKMPAGVTGLAQVHGLREQHSSEEKTRFDLQYIFHWSLFGDLSLLLQTVWTLVVRLNKREPELPLELEEPTPGSMLVAEVVDANRA